MRRSFLITLGVLLLATLAGAQAPGQSQSQKPEESWENLRSLGIGEKVQVVDQKLKSLTGRFRNFSDEAITFQVDQGEVTVPRPEVLRVTSLERTRRGRNAAIGFAIGAGVAGALVGVAVARGTPEWQYGLPSIPILGAMGAGVGALSPGYKTIYRAERRKDQSGT